MARTKAPPEKKTDWVTPTAVVLGVGGFSVGLFIYFKKKPEPGKFSFLNPTASPSTVAIGEMVTLSCSVSMEGGDGFNGTIIIQVQEGSILPGPGDFLEQKSFSVSMKPGDTKNLEYLHKAKGEVGRKDITVLVNQGATRLDQRHFDDVFYTTEETIPTTGQVNFTNSYPVIVDVWLGTYRGTTPFSLELWEGTFDWVAYLNTGTVSGTFTIAVGGVINIDVGSSSTIGSAHFISDPADANIWVEGEIPVVNGETLLFTAGWHTWEATAPGHYANSGAFLVRGDETTDVIIFLPLL